MRPPADLPSTIVALGEAFAHRAGIDPGDFWSYVYRRKAPPRELRAAIVEALFPLVSPADFLSDGDASLTSEPNRAKLRHRMQAPAHDFRADRKVGRPLKMAHPFADALRANNITVREWASEHKFTAERVKSWMRQKDGRMIPRAVAEVIEREFPSVTEHAWRNGIRD